MKNEKIVYKTSKLKASKLQSFFKTVRCKDFFPFAFIGNKELKSKIVHDFKRGKIKC